MFSSNDKERCPNCAGPEILAIPERGNGECGHCHGTSKESSIANALLPNNPPCDYCGGSGQCTTCGGTGLVQKETQVDEEEEVEDKNRHSAVNMAADSTSADSDLRSAAMSSYSYTVSSSPKINYKAEMVLFWCFIGTIAAGLIAIGIYGELVVNHPFHRKQEASVPSGPSVQSTEARRRSFPFRFHNRSQVTPQVIIGGLNRRVEIWANPPDYLYVENFGQNTYDQHLKNRSVLLVGVKDKGDCEVPVQLAILPNVAQPIDITITDDTIDRCMATR